MPRRESEPFHMADLHIACPYCRKVSPLRLSGLRPGVYSVRCCYEPCQGLFDIQLPEGTILGWEDKKAVAI